MKKTVISAGAIVAVVVAGVFMLSGRETVQSAEIKVEGMHCGDCVYRVSQKLTGLAGVAEAQVSLVDGVARVKFDPSQITVAAMETAIASLGFDTGNVKASQPAGHSDSGCGSAGKSGGMDCCATKAKGSET